MGSMSEPPLSPELAGPSLAKGPAGVALAEPRAQGAWRAWLCSLASDADAAAAAAHLYAQLAPPSRDAWLAALAEDAAQLSVPAAAVYGPLLAVETDPERRAVLRQQAGDVALRSLAEVQSALTGAGAGPIRVAVLVVPLYLDFVRVLACGYLPLRRFEWARESVMVRAADAPHAGATVDGVLLGRQPPAVVVDELAHTVVAHARAELPLPEVLRDWSELFSV